MTVNQQSSISIELQIFFWDVVIRLMSTIRNLRQSTPRPAKKQDARNSLLKTILLIILFLAIGIYAGVLLGYFGI